jgi:hypothetical protein
MTDNRTPFALFWDQNAHFEFREAHAMWCENSPQNDTVDRARLITDRAVDAWFARMEGH